jgi:PAS domain S-box-containing protein
MREPKKRDEKARRGPHPRACEQTGTGSGPRRENSGKTASGEVPVPVFSRLRATAEEQFAASPVPSEAIGEETPEQLIHELRVHQVELEMQNDELRAAQLALEDSRGKYIDLFDFAPVGYFTLTREDLIAEANLTGAALLGVVRHNLVNHRFGRFVAPEDLARWDRHLSGVFERGTEQNCELALRREDGSTFHARLDSSRTDASGAVPLVRTAVSDVTERRRAEQHLRAANARLEQAVARSEELAVRAEAANRAKSEFLANMSHEIRTPMTAILGFSDLLMAPNLPYPQQREYVAGIQSNGKALLELISDILDLSRIEADRLTLDRVDCPLRQIIDDVLSVVRVRAEQKGLALEVDYAFPLPESIHTDPARLRQVLTNLMGNAVKFTQRGSARITVCHSRETDGSARVRFAISDTGIGIPADRIGELFEPFMQVDGSSTRRYGGTGLRLPISKRLAKALGGDVEVSSQLGKGSTFTLTIDAGSPEGVRMLESPQVPATAEEQLPVAEHEVLLHGRVLLAEDVPDIYVVLRQILQMMNLELEIAEDGRAACAMAERSKAEGRPFDLILMDIQMPKMNGYEATRWLRQHGWRGPPWP